MIGLFVHDHKFPQYNNEYYYSYGFDKEFFKRYLSIFNKVCIIGRYNKLKFTEQDKAQKVDSKIDFLTFMNLKQLIYRKIRMEINSKIKSSDYMIIRLPSILGLYALWCSKKNNKPYLVEMVGCPWDAISNKGKMLILPAIVIAYLTRKAIRSAKYVVYVTEEFLERRYPTLGSYIACSNVTLNSVNENDISKRLKTIVNKNLNGKVNIGTCATIDVIYKGQKDVIKALAILKKEGYNIEYQLVGGGSTSYLKSIAKKYGVLDQVKFIGILKHDDVFKWLEQIDIYVHPSKQEGLSRAIIEAMSKGCPIFAANAGGIHELIDNEYIFDKGNVKQICDIYKKFTNINMKQQAIKNYNKSKRYIKSILYLRREKFFKSFIKEYRS